MITVIETSKYPYFNHFTFYLDLSRCLRAAIHLHAKGYSFAVLPCNEGYDLLIRTPHVDSEHAEGWEVTQALKQYRDNRPFNARIEAKRLRAIN